MFGKGYTMRIGPNKFIINPKIFTLLENCTYDSREDMINVLIWSNTFIHGGKGTNEE